MNPNFNPTTHPISTLFSTVPDRNQPALQWVEGIRYGQHEAFFHLGVSKQHRLQALHTAFAKGGIRKVCVGSAFHSCLPLSNRDLVALSHNKVGAEDLVVERFDTNRLRESDPARQEQLIADLAGCIVILNNNEMSNPEVRAGYTALYERCTHTCFVGWDWDNHHWLDLSTFLATHTDVYVPAHHENLYLLTRFNPLVAGPVYAPCVQWTRTFLADHVGHMVSVERSNAPLGKHAQYALYDYRRRVVLTLSQIYPSIGFSNGYWAQTPLERLYEWCGHKTHWIVPVLNDIPIRLFDALITGGIPIVPDSLRFLPPIRDIPREMIVFYSTHDIINPAPLVAYANRLFDEGGKDGIVARHRYALDHHHAYASLRQMLGFAQEALHSRWGLPIRGEPATEQPQA
ncbi:hypothetical protein [Candidatus Symbiobacter mobilis]|uniref:Uncharacterized protein n=1 Tax=Candidatus Symbiobacter mobilis CR TaxID=946483 RepID=U5ND36_9BURK|nr:hypothetical protein [Candidatus Symbiobacter mobilis]AGX88153.1 hypothetical protein Cenrod_2082 [Candidatus Symbiobacter mobilis CR]